MSVRVLKQYINEIIVNISGLPGGAVQKFTIADDNADELEWFLDKFGRPAVNLLSKSEGETAEEYRARRESSLQEINNVIDALAKLDPTLDTAQLLNVIEPWGEPGYDALRYIAINTKKSNTHFPFFSEGDNIGVNKVINYGSLPVSPKIISHLVNVRYKDSGRGEFLTALLTGGISSKKRGEHGDISIGQTRWEIKAPDSQGYIRLGDRTSKKFIKLFNKEFYNLQQVYYHASFKQKLGVTSPKAIDSYTSTEVTDLSIKFSSLKNEERQILGLENTSDDARELFSSRSDTTSRKIYPQIYKLIIACINSAMSEENIEGIILIKPSDSKIIFTANPNNLSTSKQDVGWQFAYISTTGGRVHLQYIE